MFCAGIQIHFPGTISSFYSAATKSNTERGPVKALQMLVQIALEIQFQGKKREKKESRLERSAYRLSLRRFLAPLGFPSGSSIAAFGVRATQGSLEAF